MKLTETHHFCVRKSLLSGNVFSPTSASSTLSIQVCIFSLNMDDIIIYVARWCQKYLSKSSLFKHTCSWRDKLIIFLWSIEKNADVCWSYQHWVWQKCKPFLTALLCWEFRRKRLINSIWAYGGRVFIKMLDNGN